jgi:hypothetical protein
MIPVERDSKVERGPGAQLGHARDTGDNLIEGDVGESEEVQLLDRRLKNTIQ